MYLAKIIYGIFILLGYDSEKKKLIQEGRSGIPEGMLRKKAVNIMVNPLQIP